MRRSNLSATRRAGIVVATLLLVLAGALSLPAGAARPAESRPNELRNPDFERGLTGWTPGGGAATTTRQYREGRAALELGPASGVAQELRLRPHTTYALSGWGKTSNGEAAEIVVRIVDGAGKATDYRIGFSNREWIRQARTITAPATIGSAQISVRKPAGSGSFWADDFQLAPGRDAQAWPFAADSIWNTPLGSRAVYKPSGLQFEPSVALDESAFPYGDWNTPRREAFTRGSIGGANDFGACNRDPARGEVGVSQGSVQIPDDFLLDNWSRNPYFTPNNMIGIMQGDGRTVAQFQPGTRCSPGDPVFGYRASDVDLYGDGIAGGHFGSGLSSIGGAIRLGELLGAGHINHALQLDLYMAKYASAVRPYRWPADRADYYHFNTPNGYCSLDPCKSNPQAHAEVAQGALLAIPPNHTAESLGIKTEVGRKIFQALQDYGGYVVDDGFYTWQLLNTEYGVRDEVRDAYGIDLVATDNATGASGEWFGDVEAMWQVLHVVANNGPDSIGGGGRPRVAKAPPFVHPEPPAPKRVEGKDSWSVTASPNAADARKIVDGRPRTLWSSGTPQAPGQRVVVDLKREREFNRVALDNTARAPQYPQGYAIYVSNDGLAWGRPVHQGTGAGTSVTLATFPIQKARWLKVELYGSHIAGEAWSLGELDLFLIKPLIPTSPLAPTPTPTITPTPSPEPLCSPNLLTNPDFEAGLDGWFRINDVANVSADARSGTGAMQAGPGEGGVGQSIAIAPGETAVLSFWAKRTDASVYNGVGINWVDADFAPLGNGPATAVTGDAYEQYTLQGVAPVGAAYASLYTYKTGTTGYTLVDDASFRLCE